MEEILADKIIAFGDRKYLKHRDIWDIHFLNNQKVRLKADLILEKIQDYHIDNLVEKLKERVEILNLEENKKNFYSEISRFISAERFEENKSWDYYEIIKRTTQQIISMAIDEIELIFDGRDAHTPYTQAQSLDGRLVDNNISSNTESIIPQKNNQSQVLDMNDDSALKALKNEMSNTP